MDDQVEPFDQPRSLSTDCGAGWPRQHRDAGLLQDLALGEGRHPLAMSVSRMRDAAAAEFSDGHDQAVDGVLETVRHRTEVRCLSLLKTASIVAFLPEP